MVVIIPAYNEERSVAQVIIGVQKAVPTADIVVINDGSQDRTAEEASRAGARILDHPYNMGYGAALQTGYKFALENGYRYLAQIDADGQHDPEYINELLAPILEGSADIVIGSRFLMDNGYRAPFAKRVGMLVFGALTSRIVGYHVTDPTSGFQALNRRAFCYCARDCYPTDFADADVLIMLHRAGLRIREVAVRMYPSLNRKSRYLNMYSIFTPAYYLFKMCLLMFVTLLRREQSVQEVVPEW
ncbi:MAG: glycosyl transferase family 2 [Ardenticatenia bacterium]|jgi:glycosyltransferase involved in cell wall biosynthesis|nr:MAG: glycosyl transferase family 2 [Ardenticatenia bacterium]